MATTKTRVLRALVELTPVITWFAHFAMVLGRSNHHGPKDAGKQGTATRAECLFAALAHLCLVLNLLTVLGGAVLALVLGLVGPRSSGYLVAQIRQALLWQLQVWVGSVALALAVHRFWGGWQQLTIVPLELLFWGAALFYALCAALLCLRGIPFRYWRRS